MAEDKDNEAIDKYISLRPTYKELSQKIASIIEEVLDSKNINFHVVTNRAKDLESFKKKIENPKYKKPFEQITDLSGIRVIAYVEDDVKQICEILEGIFTIDESNSLDKSTELGTDKVGYKSVHYICELPENRTALPEYSKYKSLKFEIQVRTILQHSWAEIEHDKNYKFQGELPDEIKRRFKLLAGTLELVDREFNQLSKEIDAYSKEVKEKTKKGDLNIPINSTSLKQYLNTKFKSYIENSQISPHFSGSNKEKLVIRELNKFGIKTLKDIELLFPDKFNSILSKEENSRVINNYLGLIRFAMLISDYKKYFKNSFEGDWSALGDEEDREFFNKFNLDTKDMQKQLDNAIKKLY